MAAVTNAASSICIIVPSCHNTQASWLFYFLFLHPCFCPLAIADTTASCAAAYSWLIVNFYACLFPSCCHLIVSSAAIWGCCNAPNSWFSFSRLLLTSSLSPLCHCTTRYAVYCCIPAVGTALLLPARHSHENQCCHHCCGTFLHSCHHRHRSSNSSYLWNWCYCHHRRPHFVATAISQQQQPTESF